MIRRTTQCLAQLTSNHSRRLFSSAHTRRPTIHRRGDHPYGSREYLLCQTPDLTNAAAKDPSTRKLVVVEGTDGMPLQVLATLKANKHMIFGASSKVDDNGANIPKLCQPLLAAAIEDCQSVGEQPQALAALYGLCDYVKLVWTEATNPLLCRVLTKRPWLRSQQLPRVSHATATQSLEKERTGMEVLVGRRSRRNTSHLHTNVNCTEA